MSPNVGNFVQDLVHMAQATERLPQVEHELADANTQISSLNQVVQSREEAIIRYKTEIESLQSKIRDAEVARDDAELRFLELDEKAGKALALRGIIADMVNQAFDLLTPPKPEPAPEPEPVKAVPVPEYKPWDGPDFAPQGQSESHPTQSDASTETLPATTASSQETAPLPSQGRYSDKLYYDHPVYVSFDNWLAGGGSEENYYRSKPTPPKDYSGTF